MSGMREGTEILSSQTARALGTVLPKAPTGIPGLDQITGGGLPRGRTTLLSGKAGSGKTLLGLQFLVSGARDMGEPGVLVTFEESAEKVSANVASLGFDIDGLQRDGLLAVLAFRVDPAQIIETGEFDFEPLFVMLDHAVKRVGAKRIVLDTIEVLFGAFHDASIVRAELGRLVRWLEEHDVTAIVTGEQGEVTITRKGIEEYVTDCVIVLDHRVHDEVSTRRLRVVKYRGSAHGTNEYPFIIGSRGFVVLPITSVALSYGAPMERMSTGVDRLDHMLSGGVYRGSTILVSGSAGTGKTTLGAHLIDAACRRGETALMVLFEESPDQVLRNMRSVGIDLHPWVEAGLLHIWAARPSVYGTEAHLAMLAQLLEDILPDVAVLDGISSVTHGPTSTEVTMMVARQVDLLKSRGVTVLATSIMYDDESSGIGVSSLVDTWMLLRNVEQDGERNRLLFVLKSRGTAHSNQVREFILTAHGAEVIDVYVGSAGVVTGSARLVQEAKERETVLIGLEDIQRHRRALQRSVLEGKARMAAIQEEIADHNSELEFLDSRRARQSREVTADRAAMSEQRWADRGASDGVEPGGEDE